VTEPLTAEELDRVRQIAGTAPDTEIGRLFVRLAARATPTPNTLDVERLRKAFTEAVNAPSVISHGGPAVLHYQDVDRIWTAILAALADLDAKVEDAG